MKPSIRAAALAAVLTAPTWAQVTFPSLNASPWLGQELVGRVTATSAVVNVAFDRDAQVFIDYGTTSGTYTARTATQTASAGTPANIALTNLSPNTRYYYRLGYSVPDTLLTSRPERTFITQRATGSTFSFLIQADPHMDNNSSADVYQLTLANELADKPDFMIDLGDTMLSDKLNAAGVPVNGGSSPNSAGILSRAQLLRSYYDLATHSVPLYLALGNHEGEWGSNLNGTANNTAIWDTQHRTSYFPNPSPDGFFTGDTRQYDSTGAACTPDIYTNCNLGQRRSYYSWQWGDAQFIVLDPYWSQTAGTTQPGNNLDCCQRNAGYWSLTLGQAQYDWLKQTLEQSTAKYKFVFSHNLIGGVNPTVNGVDQGPMRGGVEAAKYFEWGGYNLDGTWGFSTYRPNLPVPIHQLLVANKVTAFFHGHDHLYAHQTLDGISYQAVPQPSAINANLGTRATDYGYTQGTMLGGRGYLRVTVSPTGTKVDYVQTWLPSEVRGTTTNRMVADTYTLSAAPSTDPPLISSISLASKDGAAITPNSWIEIKGTNLAATTRTWQSSDFSGTQMPTQIDNVSATINGQPAYIWYVSPTQVNVLAGPNVAPGTASVQLTVNGLTSAPFQVTVQAVSPAWFTFGGTSNIAATHSDGSYLGPTSLYPGLTTPARPGETIVLYANGFGATSQPIAPGSSQQSGVLSPTPIVTIGGTQATVTFAGLVSPGLYQFNVTVPPNAPTSDLPVIATHAGAFTQAGAVISVLAPVTSTMTLTSPAGANNAAMAADYTCDGTGSTPALNWSGAPAGTKEFALLMTTLPGDGTTKWNWVLYRIPATTTSLAKDSFLVGTTGVGSDGPGTVYNPPCSQGPGSKLYTFTLYALSASPVFTVPANQVTGKLVSDTIAGLTLATATLNLTYARNNLGSSAPCLLIRNSANASKSGTASVSCDNTYAYLSSIGIPSGANVAMMNGITSTNLQVPTAINFQGANGWKIPLNPSIAASPTFVVDGPIGVAVNGIPIFNPCTQGGNNCATTGDTKAIGQLDTCNGHAGRADDYHYHAAPTCLMADQNANYWNTHPIGWALDGFAIYGFNDADGTTATRDAQCGGNTKAVQNGPAGYSYHVTTVYPYVLTCLAGNPSPDLPNQSSKYRPFRRLQRAPVHLRHHLHEHLQRNRPLYQRPRHLPHPLPPDHRRCAHPTAASQYHSLLGIPVPQQLQHRLTTHGVLLQMKRFALALIFFGSALAHDLEENRATLVLRDETHIAVTLYLNYAEALHQALLPQREYGAFLLIYSSMKPEDLKKELDRVQARFEAATQLVAVGGSRLKVAGWAWPDARQVQSMLQQQVMQAMVDGHVHSPPVEVHADAISSTRIESVTFHLPPEFQKVLVVSYKPNQVWIDGRERVPRIRF